MAQIRVASIHEPLPQQGKVVSLFGKKIGLFRAPSGELYAIEVSCKHQGADLTQGERNGSEVTCPRHGWRFDLLTGTCLWPEDGPRLRRYLVTRDAESIFIEVPDSVIPS